jgi:hypothetical protein
MKAVTLWIVGALAFSLGRPATGTAQQASGVTVRLDAGALGGVLPQARVTKGPIVQASPFLTAAQTSLRGSWTLGPLRADGGLSLVAASAAGVHSSHTLGMFHLTTRRGPIRLSFGVEQSVGVRNVQRGAGDTLPYTIPDTGQLSSHDLFNRLAGNTALVRTSHLVGGVSWNTAISILQLVAGVQADAIHDGAWIGINSSIALDASNALTIAARHQARDAAVRLPALAIGFRTTYWRWHDAPTAPAVVQDSGTATMAVVVDGDSARLRIHLPTAHHVALTGDATGWQVLEMTRDRAGWWHATLGLPDAVSRIRLRIDRKTWGPVPGLPTTRDEYGGWASLLIAPTAPRAAAGE